MPCFFGRIRDNPTSTIYWRMSIPIKIPVKICVLLLGWKKTFETMASLNCLIEFLCYIQPAFSVRMRPLQMKLDEEKSKHADLIEFLCHILPVLSVISMRPLQMKIGWTKNVKTCWFGSNENWVNKNVKTCWFGSMSMRPLQMKIGWTKMSKHAGLAQWAKNGFGLAFFQA